jgi:hypothetical protein
MGAFCRLEAPPFGSSAIRREEEARATSLVGQHTIQRKGLLMHVRPLRSGIRRAIPIAAVAGLLAVLSGAAAASAATPSGVRLGGTWSGTYSGAFSGRFTLHWTQTGSRLSGSITLSRPSGTYGIGGSVRGSAIRFGAVGAGATYTGSVSGTSMSGSYRSPQGGGTWAAHKPH